MAEPSMKYEELKALRQEGVELGKKGLFQDAQIKLYKAFNSSEDFTEFHLEVGLELVCVYRRMESYSAALDLIDYIAGYDFDSGYYVSLAYLDRALIEYRQRDYEKAIDTIQEAESLYDGSFPISKYWYLAIVKGRVHYKHGDLKEGIKCFSHALELCDLYQDKRQLQQTYDNLGEVFIASGDIEKGVALTQKALAISKEASDFFWQALNLQTLMYASFKRGDLNAAKNYASECLKIAYENEYRDVVRDVCYQIGRYYKDHGQQDVAEVFFKKASNADGRLSAEFLSELDIDIINSRGTSLGEA